MDRQTQKSVEVTSRLKNVYRIFTLKYIGTAGCGLFLTLELYNHDDIIYIIIMMILNTYDVCLKTIYIFYHN